MEHRHLKFLFAAVFILNIFRFSVGVDILSATQNLADGEVLISPGQIFELGFFSPAKSSGNKFLGIWYKATPDVVVWVANRENPIAGSGGVLTLYRNGTLILSSEQSVMVWSSGTYRSPSNPVLQLWDTGNLILSDNSSNTWQSFDYPCDTRLPGMQMVDNSDSGLSKHLTSWKSPFDPSAGDFVYRIENHGLSQTCMLMGEKKRYRCGPWNGLHFTGIPLTHSPFMEPETLFKDGRLISVSLPNTNNSLFMRLTISYTGLLQTYIMNEQRDAWVPSFALPSDTCDNYQFCGPNSLCRPDKTPPCECLRGFIPKSQKEWSLLTWTSGCTRTLPLNCQEEDGFLKVERIKSPDPLNFRRETGMTHDECQKECLNNCSCTAYAAPYLINQRNGCLMWFGDLIDVKQFTGEVTTGPSVHIRVPISELDRSTKKEVIVGTAAGFGILVLGLSIGGIILRLRCKREAHKKKVKDIELPLFDLATIAAATNHFSKENMIGKGGFGPVYKGNLSAEQVVAVKRMSKTSGQGAHEFKNEVMLIAKLQHRNLVRILGCCIEGEEKMLIYEYMQNKSLDYFIFDLNRSAMLTWPMRFDIILGIARGLLYLHHDSRLKIIHRDLKTSNILLDENFNAKISDFGLARMFQADQAAATTKRVVGTYGYMAPEYAFDGKFSVKSDVFSMGVVLLDIVTGKNKTGFKNPTYYQNLLGQAWLLWKENRELELMDPCYHSSYVESQVKRCIQVGLLCVQNIADDRPVMSSVLLMLSSEDTILPQPKKPGFFLHKSSSSSEINAASRNDDTGRHSITISEVLGR